MRREDQEWVIEQIQIATQRPELRGLKKAIGWMGEWSLIAAAITVFATLCFFAVNSYVHDSEFRGSTDQHFKDYDSAQDRTNKHFDVIDQRLNGIDSSLLAIRLQLSAGNPRNSLNQSEAKDILADALHKSVTLPEGLIEQTGLRFIRAGAKEDNAWNVALQFLNYRSFLNSSLVSVPQNRTPADQTYRYSLNIAALPPGSDHAAFGVFFAGGSAPPEESALLDSLTKPPPAGTGTGVKMLIVDVPQGGGISLDDQRMRNVIVQNAIIFYTGKPSRLENVSFLNCTFKISSGPVSTRLGQQLLASAHLTFSDQVPRQFAVRFPIL